MRLFKKVYGQLYSRRSETIHTMWSLNRDKPNKTKEGSRIQTKIAHN